MSELIAYFIVMAFYTFCGSVEICTAVKSYKEESYGLAAMFTMFAIQTITSMVNFMWTH